MTSAELALRNVRKSARDYAVYFMTLTFGICIFYVFNSLGSQQAVMDLSSAQSMTMRMLNSVVGSFSLFISVVLCFLIIYANGFLIKRRKKEFGVYLTLGMERERVSRILIWETVFMSLASLVAGLLLGIALAQGMAFVTASLLGVKISGFHFIFSAAAIGKTIIYFGLAFVLTLFFNVRQINKQQLIDLIYAGRQNEISRAPRPVAAVLFFLLSVLLLGVTYVMAAARLFDSALLLNFMLAVGAAGTFLFFFSLSGFLLAAVQRSKPYLRGLNMFVLRQLSSKINTTFVSMTIVCLMLFVSICALSSGLGMARGIAAELRGAPYDATLILRAETEGGDERSTFAPGALDSALTESRDLTAFAAASRSAVFYDVSDAGVVFEGPGGVKPVLYLLGLTDYNAALAMQGAAPLVLGPDEYGVNFGSGGAGWDRALTKYCAGGGSLTLGGRDLRTRGSLLRRQALEVSTRRNPDLVLVAPDELLAGRQAKKEILLINYPGSSLEYERLCLAALSDLKTASADGVELSGLIETKIQVNDYIGNTTATIAYLAIYMGVVFLVASATVLAIGQLSEASDNIHRYRLLNKIGADERMLSRALFTQNLICFGAPLLLALAHSAVGIAVAGQITQRIAGIDISGTSVAAALVMTLIYGGYFLATYWSSRNMVARG
ncbi:MAG: ABC transporter permease [Gracilibacteraceae bacterium]|jgi:putative ABC transport system permease protein|nr:ABC transporter permease [Gracilibacteraceae bacterium]